MLNTGIAGLLTAHTFQPWSFEVNNPSMLPFLLDDDLALIRSKSTRTVFKKGEVVLQEGAISRSLYLLVSGQVNVVKDVLGEEVVITRLEPGELLGIASLLNGSPIGATVLASAESTFELIATPDLHALLESIPGLAVRFYRSLGAVLASRLDAVLQQVAQPESR
ncbi:MAG: cyclic nucleotide-binding domain-containing protein [Magnetococcales bacterium]|nr:cyclic nucleotide-binding domain-containing protein [Magnetococcales bacterium]